ncbi:hypothetical protein BN946_scf184785.g31 [Trametes cinnabarina]|uniref:MaoC-like domain-containing protein n=1 Tax=Pycnoporus cinnabarinus TaxID=5643 RepID=A0A060S5Q0_PYCCI|nr:hypothetical protein BN946_scf184785.g31 [Trametes cinnabarina]
MLPRPPNLRCAFVAQRRPLTAASPARRGAAATQCIPTRRHYSSPSLPPSDASSVSALDRWIHADKELTLHDTIRPEHLADLYITLPTRDGTAAGHSSCAAAGGRAAGLPADHLVFLPPPEPRAAHCARTDGHRRSARPSRSCGACGRAAAWNGSGSWIREGDADGFVSQKIEYSKRDSDVVCIEEERSHVYLAVAGNKRGVKQVGNLPVPEFTFDYLPTPTTLFRFSALTFNGHYIHLDKDYAQKSEGYPERLVHGPLTALMLLDVTALHAPGTPFQSFEYRAVNPIVVNRPVRICGARTEKDTMLVWAEETSSGIIGMTGKITFSKA